MCGQPVSVKEPTAALGATVAGQLVAGILNGELIVVREFFPSVDLAHGKDDNVLLSINIDDTGVAVRLTGVIDETCSISMHGGIHYL